MWVDMPLRPHTELRCADKQPRAKGIRGEKRASGTSPEALNLNLNFGGFGAKFWHLGRAPIAFLTSEIDPAGRNHP